MKKFINLLLAFLFINIARAGEKEDIINLVYKWNELHNTRETLEFKNIYGASVLYYGKYKTRQTCFQNKDAFLSSNFKQEIISPIQLTYYSSGIIKCSFRKKVTYKTLIKKHDCYLLVKQENNQWYIVGESDLLTDKNLKVQLDLGEELVSTAINKKPFVLLGVAIIGIGGFTLYKKRKSKRQQALTVNQVIITKHEESMVTSQQEGVSAAISHDIIVKTVKEAVLKEIKTSTQEEPKESTEVEKGTAFEKYIVSRFTKEYFDLREWRGDKYHEGIYASSNQLPDLEYHFKTTYHDLRFAIECKWRSEFIKGRIEWAKSYQMVNYRNYARKNGITVFVVIGIGGKPDNPEHVYVVPLEDIRSNVLTENFLEKYRRYKTGNFYLHVQPMRLE